MVERAKEGPNRGFSPLGEIQLASTGACVATEGRNLLPEEPPALPLALIHQPPRETVWKVSGTHQPPHHQTNHSCVDERLCASAEPFVILAHPSVLIQPGEGAFHHPPPRQHHEASRRHEPLPVDRFPFLGPFLCPHLRYLLGNRLRRLAHDLHTQA